MSDNFEINSKGEVLGTEDLVELFQTIAATVLRDSTTLQDAARAYVAAKLMKEDAEAFLKRQGQVLADCEGVLLATMERTKMLAVKIEYDGRPLTLSAGKQVFYSIPSGSLDNSSVRGWLSMAGGDDLVKHTIHPQTFGSFCREFVEKGGVLHEDVKVAEKKIIKMRRG